MTAEESRKTSPLPENSIEANEPVHDSSSDSLIIPLSLDKHVIVSEIPLPRLGKIRHKIKARARKERNRQYILQIMTLLEKLIRDSFQGAKFKTLRKTSALLFRFTLEWLVERNRNIPKDHPVSEFKLEDLLVALLRRESKHVLIWSRQLTHWFQKFSESRDAHPFLEDDIPKFQAFILQFLHILKDRSNLLSLLLNEYYPLQVTPQEDLVVQVRPPRPRPSFDPGSLPSQTQPHCPCCGRPFQKERRGILWCPPCKYYLHFITIGKRLDSYLHEPVLIKLEDLTEHGLVLGGTKQGKTNSVLILIWQAREHGVPCWVFECDKDHYRHLKYMPFRNPNASSEFWHFTPKSNITPFGINPLIPPAGVPLEEHIENFSSIFEFTQELPVWAAAQFKRALIRVYKNKGIEIDQEYPATVDDAFWPLPYELIEAVEKVLEHEYSVNTRLDVGGLLRNRVRDLNRLSLGELFNRTRNIPWVELIQRNIVFELQHMDERAQRLFVCVMLTMLYEYVKTLGKHESLRLLVFIEEASTVLTQVKPSLEGASESGMTAEIVEHIVSKGRAFGLGLIIIDQTPELLPFRVRAIPQTGIIHNLENQDSLQMIYRIFRGIRSLTRMQKGEAQVTSPAIPLAQRIQVPLFPKFPDPSDLDMQTHMTPFYETYPWLRSFDPSLKEQIDALTLYAPTALNQHTTSGALKNFLMNLTPEDFPAPTGMSPAELDQLCASIELDTLAHIPQIQMRLASNSPLDFQLKTQLREHLEEPSFQLQIRELQIHLVATPSEETRDILLENFFERIMMLVIHTSVPRFFLPSIRYCLRLVVFKYLNLDIQLQIGFYIRFLHLLIHKLTKKGGIIPNE